MTSSELLDLVARATFLSGDVIARLRAAEPLMNDAEREEVGVALREAFARAESITATYDERSAAARTATIDTITQEHAAAAVQIRAEKEASIQRVDAREVQALIAEIQTF